jgi:hypothetical protein
MELEGRGQEQEKEEGTEEEQHPPIEVNEARLDRSAVSALLPAGTRRHGRTSSGEAVPLLTR